MIQRLHVLHRIVFGLLACAILFSYGCHDSKSNTGSSTASTHSQKDSTKPEPKSAAAIKPATPGKPAVADKPASSNKPAATDKAAIADKTPPARTAATKREVFTAANNPTTKGGRGAPDLDKPQSPAAWVFVDGKAGKFKEEGGQPLLQWFVEEPTRATPTFRVEAFEPLMGVPKDFKAVLRTVESEDGTDLVYGIAAREGTFEVGKEYSLLNPGENFVIRNGLTGDEVKEIAPLPPGKYAIAAGVINSATDKQSLAVTYFTVKSDE